MSNVIKRPTEEEAVEHLKTGVVEACLVCDEKLVGQWTDLHGQIRCSRCGTTYQIYGKRVATKYMPDLMGRNELTNDDVAHRYCDCFFEVPVFRVYWLEKQMKLPVGQYLGNPGYTEEEMNSFMTWLRENRPALAEYEDFYLWDNIEQWYQEMHANS